MEAKQKFQLSIRSIIDPVSFLTVAGIAGAEQYKNVFPAYGGGIEGYGKRYGAALANHVSGTLLGRAVYPSIFHQDPRYFYKGKGSIRSRALYAISAAVIARGDDGRWKPNYSRVLGNFSAAAISNLYYPASDRGGSLVVFNGLAGTGADAVSNLIREFVLKRITSHVPKRGERPAIRWLEEQVCRCPCQRRARWCATALAFQRGRVSPLGHGKFHPAWGADSQLRGDSITS